jgi:hypothetical protein
MPPVLDSIRAQTSVVLAAGVVAVLVAGVLIAAWSVSRFDSDRRGGFDAAMIVLRRRPTDRQKSQSRLRLQWRMKIRPAPLQSRSIP